MRTVFDPTYVKKNRWYISSILPILSLLLHPLPLPPISSPPSHIFPFPIPFSLPPRPLLHLPPFPSPIPCSHAPSLLPLPPPPPSLLLLPLPPTPTPPIPFPSPPLSPPPYLSLLPIPHPILPLHTPPYFLLHFSSLFLHPPCTHPSSFSHSPITPSPIPCPSLHPSPSHPFIHPCVLSPSSTPPPPYHFPLSPIFLSYPLPLSHLVPPSHSLPLILLFPCSMQHSSLLPFLFP